MTANPTVAPGYTHHKTVAAAETLAGLTSHTKGVNMGAYRHANIQIVPSGGANPTIEVAWWSAALNRFVPEHTAIQKAGLGANAPYEFSVDCNGRIMAIAVTALAAGQVDIYVGGYGLDHTL